MRITLRDIHKHYGTLRANDGINMEIFEGSIHGILGENGAGKTTTIKMIAGILEPTEGSITICGKNLAEDPTGAKQVTGFFPDRGFLYEKLSGIETEPEPDLITEIIEESHPAPEPADASEEEPAADAKPVGAEG